MAEDIPETKFYNPVPRTLRSVLEGILGLTGSVQWNGASSARPTMRSRSRTSKAAPARQDTRPRSQNYYLTHDAYLSMKLTTDCTVY